MYIRELLSKTYEHSLDTHTHTHTHTHTFMTREKQQCLMSACKQDHSPNCITGWGAGSKRHHQRASWQRWERIHLPVQEMRVQSLVQEDP